MKAMARLGGLRGPVRPSFRAGGGCNGAGWTDAIRGATRGGDAKFEEGSIKMRTRAGVNVGS